MEQPKSFAQFNEEWTRTFIELTIHTFKVQCHMDISLKTSFPKSEASKNSFEIGSIIGITSSLFRGSATLAFSKSLFLEILKNLFNEQIPEITSENEDAVSELLNIIFSNVKNKMNNAGHDVRMAIPSILRGSQIASNYAKGQSVNVLVFQTQSEDFYVELLSESLDQKEAEAPPPQPNKMVVTTQIKAAFCVPFIQGIIHTLKIQFDIEAKPGKPFNKDSTNAPPFDIAGIVGLTSNTLNGSFLIGFKEDVFLKLANKLLNESHTTIHPELQDMVAELVNISLGTAKTNLIKQNHYLSMAIPAVIRGSDIHTGLPKDRKILVTPFTSPLGAFHVEIDLRA